MPYRDNVPPLYFTGMHTASICGDNGNGKSALIDAMTWALWGRTRAKSDDDLIHAGQTEMEVEFDFAVSQQVYRVIRKHARPKRRQASGQSSLDFFVASGDGFKPITGDRISDTQLKIVDVLRMDYDTFVNSAYLRQGHADQFTVAKPAERKQVLANILGLARYDELEEQARELAKLRESEKAVAETAIKDIDAELSQKSAIEAELGQVLSQLADIEKTLREQESRLGELRLKREQLQGKQRELAQLELGIAKTLRMIQDWDEQAKQHRSRIEEYEELIAKRASIEECYTQLIEARKLNDKLSEKLGQLHKLSERKNQLEKVIEKAQAALITQHTLVQNEIGKLEATSEKIPRLKSELQQVHSQLRQLAGDEEALRAKRQANQDLHSLVNSLEANQARIAKEIEEIEEKLALLLSQKGAKCPLCGSDLGPDGVKHIEAEYAGKKKEEHDSLKSAETEFTIKKTELARLDDEIVRLEAKLNQDRSSVQKRVNLLEQEIVQAEEAGKQLTEERIRLSEIEEQLSRKDFATGEQAALHQLESELARLDYDSAQHEQVRNRLADLEQYEAPKRKLEEADRLVGQEKEDAVRAEQAAQELRRTLEGDNQRKQELTDELVMLPQLVDTLTRAETEYQALRAKQNQIQEVVGGIKNKLERIAEFEKRKSEKQKELSKAVKEEQVYRDLAEAFGKKGIQALLIEMTLPEIENEANELLSRMTDNRMHVKIETQRETKKGDVVETLDINISDELGTRSYEMFSGGETFRINFAIRIALSKLLAKRAGAPLPTLIIDEGFGTQDSTGMEKLREAIISIQDDFQKILVITHVEELRDAFPTRIDVIKTAQGSTIEVNG
jgi:exonuclease SbcC